ncbi:MAG: hypothetical protein H7A51_13775 [Akkermansiaceae bacterium]|nr:hypothetical protein [Akkermansiaceae bacterium]
MYITAGVIIVLLLFSMVIEAHSYKRQLRVGLSEVQLDGVLNDRRGYILSAPAIFVMSIVAVALCVHSLLRIFEGEYLRSTIFIFIAVTYVFNTSISCGVRRAAKKVAEQVAASDR